MLRLSDIKWLPFLSAALLCPSTSADAKSWFFVSIRGRAPTRANTYGDKDSIKKGADNLIQADLYDVFETPKDGVSETLYTVVVDCVTFAERHISATDYGINGLIIHEKGIDQLNASAAGPDFRSQTRVIANFACDPAFYKDKVEGRLADDARHNLRILDENISDHSK